MNNNTGLTYKIYKDGKEVEYWEGDIGISEDGDLGIIKVSWAGGKYKDIDLDIYTIELFYHGKKLNSSTEAAEK